MRRNVKEKCNEFHIPSDVSQKILDDIFVLNMEEFSLKVSLMRQVIMRKLDDVILSWQNCSVPSSANIGSFVQWFVTNNHT